MNLEDFLLKYLCYIYIRGLNMKKIKLMKKYAELIAVIGIGANPNQDVVIEASVEMYEFVRYLTLALYANKVKNIKVNYSDDILTKHKLLHTPIKRLTKIDSYELEMRKQFADEGYSRISLIGGDPFVFNTVAQEKLTALSGARAKAFFPTMQPYRNNELAWLVAAVPTKRWAKRVFPDCTPTQSMQKLWSAIYETCHIDADSDAIAIWKKHIATISKNANILNQMKLTKLHYTNSKGTDLEIELPKGYRFTGASQVQSRFNTSFTPNLPTEEVFASPKKDGVNGIVYATKPLSHNGSIVDNFWIRFENGKAVEYGAEKGLAVLKDIINFDEGGAYLGECALVPYHSPISMQGILYYNTLFDENASCHLALGDSFSECIHDGESMTKEELLKKGLNKSIIHVDFMIGSEDLSIIGTDESGATRVIFKDGDFAI